MQHNIFDKKSKQQFVESNIRVDNGTVAMETTHVWTPQTPVLTIIAQCTVHTLTAITSLFSSIHMVWKLPLGITLQLCLRLRWVIEMAVLKDDSPFSPRPTRPPKHVDYLFCSFRQDILPTAYQRPIAYPDELQFLPTQQDVQQN